MAGATPDSRLHQLHQAAERISNNLVELEIDPTRQLLEAAQLEGRSAERWLHTNATLTELWRRRGLLEALLERADGVREPAELQSLVSGQVIELSDGVVPLAERHLLSTARVRERCSAEELVAWMAAAFDEVRDVIGEFSGAWDRLAPKLDTARRLLAEAEDLSGQLGGPGADDMEPTREAVQRLGARLASDPLSVTAEEVEEVEREARVLRERIQEAAALRQGWEARLAGSRQRLERLQVLLTEAQAAHEELMIKVLLPSPPPAPSLPPGLDTELERIAGMSANQDWGEARDALEAWTELTDSLLQRLGQALDANRAPIRARNQFRALLDAYKVKAQRLGLLEDRELQDLFSQAHEVLYTAPSDLALSARLVRSYQTALSRAEAPREVTP